MEKEFNHQMSHACIHDCMQCLHGTFRRGFFEQFIRKLIRFPSDGSTKVDCKHTKVDLSCMFGGQEYASSIQSKSEPTLVRLEKPEQELLTKSNLTVINKE